MSCKCVQASRPCSPCPPRVLATFLQTLPVKGMPCAPICWQSWGLEHPGTESRALVASVGLHH